MSDEGAMSIVYVRGGVDPLPSWTVSDEGVTSIVYVCDEPAIDGGAREGKSRGKIRCAKMEAAWEACIRAMEEPSKVTRNGGDFPSA